jgi:hypothetical protein
MSPTLGSGLRLAKELSHLRAAEQAQQLLEFAPVVWGGVELEGNPALIKSISESIQSSNALSFFSRSVSFFSCSISLSSCFVLCSESSICISTTGSRRQLSIRKNERKGGSDEPDAPLLLERELSVGEADVVIRGIQSDQAKNAADDGFNQGLAVKAKPPPGRHQVQILRIDIHPTQPGRKTTTSRLVHLNSLRNGRGPGAGGFPRAGAAAGSVLKTLQESSERHTTCGVCFGDWKERCGWPIPQTAATPASPWCQALPELLEDSP